MKAPPWTIDLSNGIAAIECRTTVPAAYVTYLSRHSGDDFLTSRELRVGVRRPFCPRHLEIGGSELSRTRVYCLVEFDVRFLLTARHLRSEKSSSATIANVHLFGGHVIYLLNNAICKNLLGWIFPI